MVTVEAFCSYSRADEKWKRDLITALSPLERRKLLTSWHFRALPIGREWEPEVSYHLHAADLILLLISSDFINSDYCYGIEMAVSMERHRRGETRVIPILLRDCLWDGLPFSELQALPTDSRPVKSWQNKDAAWTDVVKGIESTILKIETSATSRGGPPRLHPTEHPPMANPAPQNTFFDVAATGGSVVQPGDEPRLALESVRLCERVMRTISYREEDWWRAEVGQRYLREQQELLERGGRVERIFIIPDTKEERTVALPVGILDEQAELGIDVYYVFEPDIPSGYFAWIQDFILYDEKLLRVSTTVPALGLQGRPAELHTDVDMIRRGLQWFNGLKAVSTPWIASD